MGVNFCPSCGDPLQPGQKFCEKCGAKIDDSAPVPSQTKSATSPVRSGGIFDINRNYYVLKEKYWDWGSGDILDEKGQPIGRMHRKIISLRRKVELMELDGTIQATIHAKIVSARGSQDLKDPEGNMIARIKKSITSVFRPKFYLESPDGDKWYEAQGKFMGWSYKVTNFKTGELVAEIEKADRWRDIFLGGMFDFKDTYALRIHDNKTDRRILVGFVLSIDNVLHDH